MRLLKTLSILLALCLVGCSAQPRVPPRTIDPPYGGVIFVQSASAVICNGSMAGCSQQIFTVALPNVGDGDTIKVALFWFASYFIPNPSGPGLIPVVPPNPTIQDSANSSYSLVQMVSNYGSPAKLGYIFSVPSINSGGNSVTIKLTLPFATQNYTAMVALEYSGGTAVDGQGSLSTNGPTPANSGPFTISSDQDVVLSLYFGGLVSPAPCSSCNLRFSGANFVVQDAFPTAAGTYTAQFSSPTGFGTYAVAAAGFQ